MGNGVTTAHGAASGVAAATGPRAKRTPLDWMKLLAVPILVVLLLLMPLVLSEFRLQLLAKYLCFAFPAAGIVLIWGYGGILSLGQGIFFGLGSYMMAMFLKLESTTSDSSAQQLAEFFGSNLPDFMVWNSVEALPWWWEPFHSFWFTLPAIIVIPAVLAFVLAYANFRKRVGGVYFSIITLAFSAIMAIVIIGQQGVTGGVNGITDFKTFFGISFEEEGVRTRLYVVTVLLLAAALVVGRFIVGSRLGKILVAIRDREDRVRFSGYDPALFKAFVFACAAVLASIGGALFTLQVGLASPSLVGIVPSIEMVIYAAVGGRLSVVGAVYGAVLVGAAKTYFSENFVEYWLYFIGGLFMVVVMFLPSGLAGLLDRFKRRAPVHGNGEAGRPRG
jgi:urea transport system permease protein